VTTKKEENSPTKSQFFTSPKRYELTTSECAIVLAEVAKQPRQSP
jgi:hypothetical protein